MKRKKIEALMKALKEGEKEKFFVVLPRKIVQMMV
jgi:hypothetical protein